MPKALIFDVFGTVVDWRGSITREARALAEQKGIRLNAGRFANEWRSGYQPAMDRVRKGELPWLNIDALHRLILDELIPKFQLNQLSEEELNTLNRAWHRLKPWPDSVRGLKLLKKTYTISPLSNGNFSLLNNMAKHSGLPWDCIISAELFGHYKPDPETYLGSAKLLDLEPEEVMLCAAHKDDLLAAQACGLKTAFIKRPREFAPSVKLDLSSDERFDFNVDSILDLADQLNIVS
ncbi:MAG: haloacid dehalogenase type II [Proteobacteria bacterium]|nr:haloacid dehalogenase type II [Pseudomonadota bacterium]MDA0861085.1 haloacid dehalogenase type II [Pseudomonadota bacterium]